MVVVAAATEAGEAKEAAAMAMAKGVEKEEEEGIGWRGCCAA